MRVLPILGALTLTFATTGCLAVATPAAGTLYTDVKWGGEVTPNSGSSKVGMSEATSLFGLIATGDASVDAAADNGGITKIHHVDYHTTNILGIFGKVQTKVYGE